VAKVSAAGVITAVAPGSVEVMAYPKGDVSLALPCQVVVKRDVPRLEIGGDRTARPGDTLLFPVKATQAYGVVAALEWDLDGDGRWDDSVAAETAMPRRAYDGKDTLMAAVFQVRDGEGNVTQAFVFVHVGFATRLLPPAFSSGTTPSPTSDPRPTWKWAGAAGGVGRYRISLDGGPEWETRDTAFTPDSLRDGAHSLSLRELDAFGSSSPTISRVIEVEAGN
jgi:large repetitive protein